MLNYGSETTRQEYDNDQAVETRDVYQDGKLVRTIRTREQRVRVANGTEEMSEFLRFKRAAPEHCTVTLKIESKVGKDGRYDIVLTWTETV